MADKTVMDAVNAALGDSLSDESELEDLAAGEELAGADAGELPEGTDPDAAGSDDDADPEGGEGENAAGETESKGEASVAELAAKAQALGVDVRDNGKFKSRETLAADVAAAEAAKAAGKSGEAAAKAAVAGKKEPDALNDPIPKDLKQETQTRIRTLISSTKEAIETRDKAVHDFDYMVKGVQATGASPEQYGETLSWLAMFNSNDPKQQEKALDLIETVADRLSTLLGKERAVGDPLNAHADLKAAVAAKQITGELAREMARTRNQNTFKGQIQASNTLAEREQAQHEETLTKARTDLNDLEKTLAASDPNYAAKREALIPILKPMFKQIHPSKWTEAFTNAYRASKATAPAAARTAPKQQPLRGRSTVASSGASAAGQVAKPATEEAAATGALAAMNAALGG